MSFEVNCGKCGARFTLPDDLYERKVRGRVVTVRCKKCRADISVDGTKHEAVDATPTVPLSGPGSLPAVEGLWVVSFGDDDDRELTLTQLKKALEKGEIDRDTLVWNTSLDEWLTIAEVPALADLVKADEVGGFLGTGVAVGPEAELLGEDEIGPFRSVGAGTMSERPEGAKPAAPEPEKEPAGAATAKTAEPPVVEGTPTVPLAAPPAKADKPEEPGSSKRPPKPEKKLPVAPPKVRPAWLSDPPPKPPATVDPDLPEGEEPAPSSGTPDLRTLMGSKPDAEPEVRGKDESVSEDIFAIGGGGIATALPTIDLTSIEPPPSSEPRSSRKKRDEEAAASSERPKAKKKTDTKTKRPPPAPSARESKAQPAKEEEKGGSPLVWLLLAAAGAFVVYWFFLRTPEPTKPSEPTARPTAETRTDPTPPVVPTPSPTPTVAAPAVDAAATAVEDAAAATKEEKPTGKEEKPSAGTGGAGGDVAMAPPFDANAARASLASAASAAAGCRKEGDPAGTATVVVTFAPSGRVTTANISGPPFAGTPTGGCIAAAMRGAKVPAFSGERVTVSKTVVIQ